MSHIIDQAEELRQQAISLLLAERETIDRKLNQLGHDGAEPKTGRVKKCSRCGTEGHSVRTCTAPETPAAE